MSKTHLLHKLLLLFALVLAGAETSWATTYKLTKVTSVSAGNMYVFERNNRVLSNTVTNKALQTTASYSKTGLAGNEFFVWTLESATNGFYMKNESLSNKYLNNSSSTEMSFGSKSSIWTFSFTDGVALISNTSNSNRFLGDTDNNTYQAYATSNLSNHGHDFTVYILEKEIFPEILFEESFSQISGNTQVGVDKFDNPGWTKSGNVYGGGNSRIRLSDSSNSGSVTTPVLTGLKETATLTFKTGAYNTSEETISISGTNCTVSPSSFNDLTTSLTEKKVTITVTGDNPQITFSSAKGVRVYLDDIVIKPRTAVDVKLSSTGYASYCSTFALDLTPTEDYSAWVVKSTNGTMVEFAKITGKVPANTPFILYNPAKSGETVSLPIIEDDDEGIAAVTDNMLRGTLSPTYVTTVEGDYTNFGLSGGSFVKINDGTVPANKAYLPILTSNVPTGARLAIVFDDETTGIEEIENGRWNNGNAVYDMQGRRVSQPTKGLYIVNGKKVAIK